MGSTAQDPHPAPHDKRRGPLHTFRINSLGYSLLQSAKKKKSVDAFFGFTLT